MDQETIVAVLAAAPARIVVPGIEEVRNIEFDNGFARIMVMLDKSRQGASNWLIPTLYAFSDKGGRIVDDDGNHLPIRFRDELRTGVGLEEMLFGLDDSMAWNTNVKKHAFRPMRRRPQTRCVKKYQYYYAAFALHGLLHMPVTDVAKARELGLA